MLIRSPIKKILKLYYNYWNRETPRCPINSPNNKNINEQYSTDMFQTILNTSDILGRGSFLYLNL
jgi:hypothetical protein